MVLLFRSLRLGHLVSMALQLPASSSGPECVQLLLARAKNSAPCTAQEGHGMAIISTDTLRTLSPDP